jgi:ABC-type Co2+ transport system permease subunit
MNCDFGDLVQRIVKYLIEGLAVAIAAYFLPNRKLKLQEIALVSLTAAATFAVLDQFAPSVGSATRFGSGFGIGTNLSGYPM